MKITDVIGHLTMPVSLEETAILERFHDAALIDKVDLTEREAVIVKQMVTRGLLDRHATADGTHFRLAGYGEE